MTDIWPGPATVTEVPSLISATIITIPDPSASVVNDPASPAIIVTEVADLPTATVSTVPDAPAVVAGAFN